MSHGRDIGGLDESSSEATIRRLKNNPFLTFGMVGFLATVAVGAYKFKNRPKGMSAPLFIVQLRVAAQSVAIGSISVGMIYGMLQQYVFKKPNE